MSKIRILHIVSSLAATGVPTMLYNYYSYMDRNKIHFDFVTIPSKVEHTYKQKFEDLGSAVYYMPKSYRGRFTYLYRLMKDGQYDIVHSHIELASAVYLTIAKLAGIKKRYAHAHMAFLPYNKLHQKLLRSLLRRVSTHKIGCSKNALYGLFGKQDGMVLHNAIDIDKFEYSPEIRAEYRLKLGLENNTVIGFVGRFSYQKNIFYLLDIFKEYIKLNSKAKLVIAGDGEQKVAFFKKADEYSLQNKIVYLGSRNDIPQLMMAMDCLLLPSRWEGLGIVLIEAQAAALMSFTSRTTVPYEDTNISPYIKYCDISSSPTIWANEMHKCIEDYHKTSIREILIKSNYSIQNQAYQLFSIYIN